MIAVQLGFGEHDLLCVFVKPCTLECNFLCFLQGNEICFAYVLNMLSHHRAAYRIDSVCPLGLIVCKDKQIIRCFNAAVNQFFFGKGNPFRTFGVINGNPFCVGKKNISSAVDNVARFCVNLIVILIFTGVKLQQVIGLALIAVQLLLGEHNLFRIFNKTGVFKRD